MGGLGLGDCFDHPNMAGVRSGTASEDVSVKQVSCDASHDMQIVAQDVIKASRSDPYPTNVEDQADAICRSGFESFVGTSFDNVAERYGAIRVFPDESQWKAGSRTVVCAAYLSDGNKLKATLQGAGS
jgi:hypothetical protein